LFDGEESFGLFVDLRWRWLGLGFDCVVVERVGELVRILTDHGSRSVIDVVDTAVFWPRNSSSSVYVSSR